MAKRTQRVRGPRRGEIYRVNFNAPLSAPTPDQWATKENLPTTGDEMFKTRPAAVLSIAANWTRKLRIVVPITEWDDTYETDGCIWMIKLPMTKTNGLDHDSAADTFQVKSVSLARFGEKLGVLTAGQLKVIAQTVAYNIGYNAIAGS